MTLTLRSYLSRAAFVGAALLSPVAAFAQAATPAASNTLATFFTTILNLIDNVAVPLIFAVAFIVFLYGIFRTFIAGAANEEKRQEGQKIVIYGLIGFFIMFSIWASFIS